MLSANNRLRQVQMRHLPLVVHMAENRCGADVNDIAVREDAFQLADDPGHVANDPAIRVEIVGV